MLLYLALVIVQTVDLVLRLLLLRLQRKHLLCRLGQQRSLRVKQCLQLLVNRMLCMPETYFGLLVRCAQSSGFVDPRLLLLPEFLQLLLQLRIPIRIPLFGGRSAGFVRAQFIFELGHLRAIIPQLVVLQTIIYFL